MSEPDYSGGLSLADAKKKIGDREIYRLSSNENPLGPSPKTVAAMTTAARSINLYPPRDAAALRAVLAAQHGVTAEHVFTGAGGCEVIELAFRQFTQPGDNFIVCPPTFGFYYLMAKRYGLSLTEVPLVPTTFALDIDGIVAAVTEDTRFVVIINPNNPTGTCFPDSAFTELLARLPAHVTVLADEVYFHFAENPHYPDTVAHLMRGANIIRVHSFSKAYGMGGMRVGYGIASAPVAAEMRKLMRPFHLNAIALEGAIAAVGDAEFVEQTVQNNAIGKAYLQTQLDRLGVTHWPTDANFLLLETKLSSGALTDALLLEAVMVRDPKDSAIPNCVRVTIGTPAENAAFIAALEKILATLDE